MNSRAAFYIASHEGLVPARYEDMVGVDTFGIGHTAAAGDPVPKKMAWGMPEDIEGAMLYAWGLFENDLAAYESDVKKAFGPGLAQHELAGLVSWHFNTGGAHTSSAVKKWRRGDKEAALSTILSWNKVTRGGQKVVSQALKRRRKEEVHLIRDGRYPERTLPVYRTRGRGEVIWSPPIYVFTYDDWMKFLGSPETRALDRDYPGIIAGVVTAIAAVSATLAAFWDTIAGRF